MVDHQHLRQRGGKIHERGRWSPAPTTVLAAGAAAITIKVAVVKARKKRCGRRCVVVVNHVFSFLADAVW